MLASIALLTVSMASCADPGAAADEQDAQVPSQSEPCVAPVTVPPGGATTPGSGAAPAAPGSTEDVKPSFPLRVDAEGAFLVDAADSPFRVQGDSAWSLIAGLSREDADLYLTSRAASRFNTILVNLIEHEFIADPPANAYGVQPFVNPGDFAAPNEEYFDHADWVIQRAEDLGLVLLLTPSYIGYAGTSQGWYAEMEAAGVDVLTEYGRYLGRRFGHHQNIIWVNGGDADPDRPELIDAIARGLHETDPDALQSAHGAPGTDAADFWGDYDWLDVNNVYSYDEPYGSSIEQYTAGATPFFLLESTYESEHDATTRLLRTQAYHALLAGAIGHVFGNNPIWHFDGPGLHGYEGTWQDALSSPGTSSMEHLDVLFDSLPWWTLVPDICHEFLQGETGESFDRTVAAVSTDRTLAVVYTPTGGALSVDLSFLGGEQATIGWYDPTSGQFHEPPESVPTSGGVVALTPPGPNTSGDADWVLVVQS